MMILSSLITDFLYVIEVIPHTTYKNYLTIYSYSTDQVPVEL